jgi:hypothetical protein
LEPPEAGDIFSRCTSASDDGDDVPDSGSGAAKRDEQEGETPSQREEDAANEGDGGDSGDKDPDENNDDAMDDGDEDEDIEEDIPTALLMEAALKCVQVMQHNQGGALAFVGGFAFQQQGMQNRTTLDIDFICQKLGNARKALERDPDFQFGSRLASGAFLAHYKARNNSGEIVMVPINGLQAGEFGPRRIVAEKVTYVNGIPVLNWTELLRMKIKSYAARQVDKDRNDILYCLEHHRHRLDTGRLEDVVFDNFDSCPTEIQLELNELFGYDLGSGD